MTTTNDNGKDAAAAQPLQVEAAKKLKGDVEVVLAKQRAVSVAQEAVTDVQRKYRYGKCKVDKRYRRRKDRERARIAELEEQKRKLEAMKDAIDVKAAADAREQEYEKELGVANAAVEAAEKELADFTAALTKGITAAGLDKDPRFATATTSYFAMSTALQRVIDGVVDEKAAVDAEGNAGWAQANPHLATDRDLKLLYGDIRKSNWMINPNKGQSSSETLQRLEIRQRKIEIGELPPTDDYVEVTDYFLYSETRQCVVHLHKQKAHPATWEYASHYVPCPFDEAVKIFNSCQGRSVTAMPQYAVDKDAFADV